MAADEKRVAAGVGSSELSGLVGVDEAVMLDIVT